MTDAATAEKPDKSKDKPKSHKVTYVPAPGDSHTTTWNGVSFVAGQAVDVTDPAMVEAATANPRFAVDDQKIDHAKDDEAKAKEAIDREVAELEAKLAQDAAEMNARQEGEHKALQVKHEAERDVMRRRHEALDGQKDLIRKRHELILRQRVEREGMTSIIASAPHDIGELDARHRKELEDLTGKEAEARDLRLMTPTLDTEVGPQPGKPSGSERQQHRRPADK